MCAHPKTKINPNGLTGGGPKKYFFAHFDRLCIALIKRFQHLNNHTRCPGNPDTPVSPFVDVYP